MFGNAVWKCNVFLAIIDKEHIKIIVLGHQPRFRAKAIVYKKKRSTLKILKASLSRLLSSEFE